MRQYKPKPGANFYMVNSRGEVRQTVNNGSTKATKRIAYGNSFKTADEAETYRKVVANYGKYGWQPQPVKVGVVAKILTWLVYLLLALLVIAACLLVVNFIFWLYDINVTIWGFKL